MAILCNSAANQRAKRILLFALFLFVSLSAAAQSDATISVPPLKDPSVAAGTQSLDRFVAAHGQRGFIAGYATKGLEAWVYPFQIFTHYCPFFHLSGTTESIDGQTLLNKIEYRPESITRIYQAPKFTVRETLFMPLDTPGGIITYSVESKTPLQIEVHLTPVMGLMWPAAHTLASAQWDQPSNSISLLDLVHGYRAFITAPQSIAHTWPVGAQPTHLANNKIQLSLVPDASGFASIAWSLSPNIDGDVINEEIAIPRIKSAHHHTQVEYSSSYTIATLRAATNSLIDDHVALESASIDHYKTVEDNLLQVETPDPAVNQAILWSEIALDQAWACNPDLGCGFVAGYGPSRIERRPQYAWFFAGDGLVSAGAALAAGDSAHTRKELEFILHYQDKKSGQIWHELTQSAPLIDWANKYPYLFVHVDITFGFLSFVHQYVTQSGDTDFLRQNWPAIQLAYRYASSIINPETGLPRIPSDKEGGDEQTRLIDDLGLSTSWVDASAAYASMAGIMGDAAAANEAAALSQRARAKFQSFYWSDANQFWINGRTITGALFEEQRSGPSEAIDLHLFTPEEEAKILNRIASPDFVTPWGIRSVAANSPGYKPTSYGQGSIWPVGTLPWAETFWSAHRPSIAFKIWSSQIPLTTLDSAGHIHEVFEGSQLRPQLESVPEQTWSSATLLTTTVHGLLGIEPDALHSQLNFSPRLPIDWPTVTINKLRLGSSQLDLQLNQTPNSLLLKIDNPGPAFHLLYNPELPLGAQTITATQNHAPIASKDEAFPQSTIAHLSIDIPSGTSEIQIHFTQQK